MNKEIWKPVKDFSKYETSNFGNVRSYKQSSIINSFQSKLLTPNYGSYGHAAVSLRKGNKTYTKSIHRLVLEAFVGSCPSGHEANHKDSNPQNNRLTNLEWTTPSKNIKHSFKYGYNSNAGECSPTAKLRDEEVLEIRRLAKQGVKLITIAKMFKIDRGHTSAIVNRKKWNHI